MYINLITIDLCPGQNGGGVTPSGTLTISENGEYNVYSYASASVNVPSPQFVTESLSVSANGTYTPGEGVDGYSRVVVDVPQSVTGFTEKEVTEGIKVVNLSNSASYVHPFVFEKDNYLQTVNLPNCTSVGEAAFANCDNLKTVNLPECKTIRTSAFYYCQSLAELYLPKCEYIGNYAFYSCNLLSGVFSLPLCSYIDSGVFEHCLNITSVYIPLIKSVYSNTFKMCIKLSSFYISSCEYIGEYAFEGTIISEANFPLCYEVRGGAFRYCSSLQKASFPNCYTFGGWGGLFNDDVSLEELTLNMNNYANFYSNYNSFSLSKTKLASGIGSIYVQSWHYDKYITANGWSSLSERFVSVPVSSMLSFSNGLLSGYTNIIEYYFNSYIGIEYSEVIDVSLPNVYSVIPRPGDYPPQYVFRNKCNNLQTLYLGSMSLCPDDFMNRHSNIRTMNLPICTSIGKNAFELCNSLSNISFPYVEYIDNGAFSRCYRLQSIDLPNVKYISRYVFLYCSSLSEVSLPNVEYIGDSAFTYCNNITSINLPKCSILEEMPFYSTNNLSILILGYSSVVNVTRSLYTSGITSSTGSIYVPASLVDAYKSANYWSMYSNIIFPIK